MWVPPPDPMCHYTAILVSVHGNPIKTKPGDTKYIITIWDGNYPQSRCVPSELYTIDPSFQFPLESTIDASDMEHLYGKYLSTYIDGIQLLEEIGYGFKGAVARSSYLKDIKQRTRTLLDTKERVNDSQCAHIKSRKKKSF